MELLRDKPEFKEKIEDNIFLVQDIEAIINDIEIEVSFDCDKKDIIAEIIEKINANVTDIEIGKEKIGEAIIEKEILALDIFNIIDEYTGDAEVLNKKQIAFDVIEKMSEFVRENYGISIKEAYLQTVGIL